MKTTTIFAIMTSFSVLWGAGASAAVKSVKNDITNDSAYINLSGKEAKDLFNFLPAIRPHFFPSDVDNHPLIEEDQFGCYLASSDEVVACGLGGPSFPADQDPGPRVKIINRRLDLGRNYAPPISCDFVPDLNRYSCSLIISRTGTYPFYDGLENANNGLGKSLNGQTYLSPSGKIGYTCSTISTGRYYDCFTTFNP